LRAQSRASVFKETFSVHNLFGSKFERRTFLYLIFGFIVAVIVGTVSHELGHYGVAKVMGLDASLSYGWVSIYPPHSERIITESEWFLITLGGPLQTMLTGTIGLGLIFLLRTDFLSAQKLSFTQWTLVFITFFWSRQSANFLTEVILSLTTEDLLCTSDELKLSQFLQLPDYALSYVTGIIGFFILSLVFFKFIPRAQRLTFISAGIVGSPLGIFLWFGWLGKILLP
jgi:hypothetical protein